MGWLREPLGQRVKLLAPRNERHLYLSRDEVQRLASASGEARDAVLLRAYTGPRFGELFALRQEQHHGDVLVLDAGTKSARPRAIPLPPPVQGCAIPLAVTRARFRRLFDQARQAIGRPELHAHDLRHTYASLLVQAGAPLTAVRDLLGHAHLGGTSRYAHLQPQHLQDAIRLLEHPDKKPDKEKGRSNGAAS